MNPVDRYVVLGVAQVRAGWSREVTRWAASSMLPIELVKAMSLEEVRVRLRSGRSYSALLVDDATLGLDRDLVGLATDAGCAVVIVDSGRNPRPWSDLGAAAVLPEVFDRDDLLQVLTQVATRVSHHAERTVARPTTVPGTFRGALVAVTGSGGAGRSTVAAALAQALASDPGNRAMVCLADLAHNGEQAMLHGSPDVVPGIVELVDAHRGGTPAIDEVRRLSWAVPERGYHLVLGLRRHRDWTAIRPRAFAAALDSLRRGFRTVVADVDADLEGEHETGSTDVEDRNGMARATTSSADLVVVVGLPGMKGLHSLLRTTRDLLAHGVAGSSLLPVINRAPRGPRARAELTSAFATLLGPAATSSGSAVPGALHLADRRHLDDVLRDGVRFPDAWIAPVATAVQALIDRSDPSGSGESSPGDADPAVPIRPGSLGSWAEEG